MRFVVGVKQDMNVRRAYVHKRKGIPIFEDPTYELNPYDRRAIEAALQLKESHGGTVISITIGGYSNPELVAREALAMGVDEAILVEGVDPIKTGVSEVAQIFMTVLEKIGSYDLILFGERSTDYSGSAFGQYISGLLNIPLIYRAVSIRLENRLIVAKEKFSGGVRTVKAKLPTVLVISSDGYKPRYPSAWSIADAFRREVKKYDLSSLGIELSGKPFFKAVRYIQPEAIKPRVEKLDAEQAARKLMRIVGGR